MASRGVSASSRVTCPGHPTSSVLSGEPPSSDHLGDPARCGDGRGVTICRRQSFHMALLIPLIRRNRKQRVRPLRGFYSPQQWGEIPLRRKLGESNPTAPLVGFGSSPRGATPNRPKAEHARCADCSASPRSGERHGDCGRGDLAVLTHRGTVHCVRDRVVQVVDGRAMPPVMRPAAGITAGIPLSRDVAVVDAAAD